MSRLETFTPEGGVWRSLRGSDTPTIDPDPPPVENVSLLVSSVELAMWRDRAVNGPFRVSGDFQTNSPGHWNEMDNVRNQNFANARWSGPPFVDSGGKVLRSNENRPGTTTRVGTGNDPPGEAKRNAHDMMSAAYAAIVLNDTTTARKVVEEIVWHAQQDRLNYASRTRWPYDYYIDLNPMFVHCDWVRDFATAYDVCRAMGQATAAQQTTIEGWFTELGLLGENSVHGSFVQAFPNRKTGNYTSRASWVDDSTSGRWRRFDGQLLYSPGITNWYNNRRSAMAGMMGMAGLLADNATLIAEFKRYMREMVMFGHGIQGETQGLMPDTMRATDGFPQLGFAYALNGFGPTLMPMDALARQGDAELYEFSSSDGADIGSRGTKHLKTMEQVLDIYMRWVRRTWPAHYASGTRPHPENLTGDAFYRVHSRHTGNDREMINDSWWLIPANFYNRTDWQDTVLRVNHPQFPAYTSTYNGVGSIQGARTDWRQRFLRSRDANPYGGA